MDKANAYALLETMLRNGSKEASWVSQDEMEPEREGREVPGAADERE